MRSSKLSGLTPSVPVQCIRDALSRGANGFDANTTAQEWKWTFRRAVSAAHFSHSVKIFWKSRGDNPAFTKESKRVRRLSSDSGRRSGLNFSNAMSEKSNVTLSFNNKQQKDILTCQFKPPHSAHSSVYRFNFAFVNVSRIIE